MDLHANACKMGGQPTNHGPLLPPLYADGPLIMDLCFLSSTQSPLTFVKLLKLFEEGLHQAVQLL